MWQSPFLTAGRKQSCFQKKSWRTPIYATLTREAGACLGLKQPVGNGFKNENVSSLNCIDWSKYVWNMHVKQAPLEGNVRDRNNNKIHNGTEVTELWEYMWGGRKPRELARTRKLKWIWRLRGKDTPELRESVNLGVKKTMNQFSSPGKCVYPNDLLRRMETVST